MVLMQFLHLFCANWDFNLFRIMCEGSKKLRCVEYVVGVSLSVCLSHKHPVITEVINKHQAQVSH